MAADAEANDIPPPETEEVTKTRIACDGSEGALGHPRVWLSIDPRSDGWIAAATSGMC